MIPFDCDAFSFVLSTGMVLFASKPQLRKNLKSLPAQYEREFLADNSMTGAQKTYIAPIDAELRDLGYLPFYTLRVTNYGSNLLRGYLNPTDCASCTLTIVEVRVKVGTTETLRTIHSVNFTTRLMDGKELVTRNMASRSLMDAPEYKIVQECRNVTNLAVLKKRHDAKAASLGAATPPPRDIESVVTEFNKEHERFCAHQVSNGILQPSSDGTAYVMTEKVFNRGIQNFFNPFAKRLSPTKMLFSALAGAVLPLYGIMKLAPAAAERFPSSATAGLSPGHAAILSCYVLTGTILGLITESQSYIWVTMITYIPAHLIAGWSFGWLPYSGMAFLVSSYVCRAKWKHLAILQTR
jgi:hypothetical protein